MFNLPLLMFHPQVIMIHGQTVHHYYDHVIYDGIQTTDWNRFDHAFIHANVLRKLNAACDFVCCSCNSDLFWEVRTKKSLGNRTFPRYEPFLLDVTLSENLYVCYICRTSIYDGKIPKLTKTNGMKFSNHTWRTEDKLSWGNAN